MEMVDAVMQNLYSGQNVEGVRVSASERVLTQQVIDGMVVLDLARGEYYGLDELGAKIWEQLVGGTSVKEIVSGILEEYQVDEARATADVIGFLRDIESKGLWEIHVLAVS